MSSGRSRSTLVLLAGVAVAVAVGAIAGLLKPNAPAPSSTPGNVAIPVPKGTTPIDSRVVQEGLLEELILDAATAERPDRLPALSTFVLLVGSRPDEFGWVVERLAEPGVPVRLLTSFVAHLPPQRGGSAAVAQRLLVPLLERGDPERRRLALDVLRARGETAFTTASACGCAFGHYPAKATAGQPLWLLAFSLNGQDRLAWEPLQQPGPVVWNLNLRSDPEGERVRVHRLGSAPLGSWPLVGVSDGSGQAIAVMTVGG